MVVADGDPVVDDVVGAHVAPRCHRADAHLIRAHDHDPRHVHDRVLHYGHVVVHGYSSLALQQTNEE